jgi:hypothetical protein
MQRGKGKRLHRDQLLQEGKEWFLDQQVGPFLDKVRNLDRGPGRVRLPVSQNVLLYVSNLRARTKDDISLKLKGTGMQILREDLAKFEMKYSRKLRLETTTLTVLVRSDSKLEDIMQGKIFIEGIMGPATFTILNDEVDTVHHVELKPNSQIDRKRFPS